MTVSDLLTRASGQELSDWMAYEEEHGPLGPRRGDWQAALIASTVASAAYRGRGKRPKMIDYLLKWKTTARQGAQDPEAMERLGRQLAARTGGTWTEARR